MASIPPRVWRVGPWYRIEGQLWGCTFHLPMVPILLPLGNLRYLCPNRSSTICQKSAYKASCLLGCSQSSIPQEARSHHLPLNLVLTELLDPSGFDNSYQTFKASSHFTNILLFPTFLPESHYLFLILCGTLLVVRVQNYPARGKN